MSQTIGTSGRKFKLHRIGDILSLSSPEWRVQGILPVGGLTMLYAPQGQAKTFLALDMALCAASGTEFHGRKVKKGPVVYILGEGRGGLKKRITAWLKEHHLEDIPDAFFVLEGVQFHRKEDVAQLRKQIAALDVDPAMLFIDTFARNAVSVDENDATAVGEWVDAVGTLQNQMEVDVVILHHAQKAKGKKEPRERGSSAFIGAMDTVLRIKKHDKTLTVTCEKQKDAEHFDSFSLHMKVVTTGMDANGDAETSCVLVDERNQAIGKPLLSPESLRMLTALAEFPFQTASRKDWLAKTGFRERTFDRYRQELQDEGYVQPSVDRGAYKLTPLKGLLAIASESPANRHDKAA